MVQASPRVVWSWSRMSVMREARCTLYACSRGSSSRNPLNRRKSLSVEHSTAPCSSASAASAVSVTKGPLICASPTWAQKISQNLSPGSTTVTFGRVIQLAAIVHAAVPDRGFRVAFGLVAMRTNARMVCQGRATISSAFKVDSSHTRQVSWCAALRYRHATGCWRRAASLVLRAFDFIKQRADVVVRPAR